MAVLCVSVHMNKARKNISEAMPEVDLVIEVLDARIPFFFTSRRRHTIWTGDWSSDVCSSDLSGIVTRTSLSELLEPAVMHHRPHRPSQAAPSRLGLLILLCRSEERRVGKESRWLFSAFPCI